MEYLQPQEYHVYGILDTGWYGWVASNCTGGKVGKLWPRLKQVWLQATGCWLQA